MRRSSSRSSNADASSYSPASRAASSARRRPSPASSDEERPAGGDEQADRLGQARAARGHASCEVIDKGRGLGLRGRAGRLVAGLGVEMGDQRIDQPASILPVALELDPALSVRAEPVGVGRVAPPVGPGQPIRAGAEARQRSDLRSPVGGESLDRLAGRTGDVRRA